MTPVVSDFQTVSQGEELGEFVRDASNLVSVYQELDMWLRFIGFNAVSYKKAPRYQI